MRDGGERKTYQILVRNLKKKDNLRDSGKDMRKY
jgi:hypothetical protein